MASRAVFHTQKKIRLGSVRPGTVIQGFLSSKIGKLENPDSQPRSLTRTPSLGDHHIEKDAVESLAKQQHTLATRHLGRRSFEVSTLRYELGISGEHIPLEFRWAKVYVRYVSTDTAWQPVFGGGDDKNEEPVIKRKKEPSPEECDQAVEGLSSVKAKAKGKKLKESQKGASFILKKVWAVLLGIGSSFESY